MGGQRLASSYGRLELAAADYSLADSASRLLAVEIDYKRDARPIDPGGSVTSVAASRLPV